MAANDSDLARARESGFAIQLARPIVSSSVVLALETE